MTGAIIAGAIVGRLLAAIVLAGVVAVILIAWRRKMSDTNCELTDGQVLAAIAVRATASGAATCCPPGTST